jgi:flavin reductase (DIM6/NTAB) family NADH-FMN oxidoreductase RutF
MLKRIIKKWLLGTDLTQEYICTGLENFSKSFNISLSFQTNSIILDVTNTHIFLGYKPVIMGVSIKKDDTSYNALINSQEVCMSFHQGAFKSTATKRGFPIDNKSQAILFLKKAGAKKFDDTTVFIFEGVKGEHRFLSSFHQFTNKLVQRLKEKGANNVGLPGNLYEQVRIAYSIPRIISIISLGRENKYNLFPTDLHGSINEQLYVSSLRYGGKACKQVEEIKKITISNVSMNSAGTTYSMGKNHMQDLKPITDFDVLPVLSKKFQNPLNKATLSYKELELIDSFDVGIHRLLFYKIVNTEILNNESSTLSHIHQYYEAWRQKHGLKTEALIR